MGVSVTLSKMARNWPLYGIADAIAIPLSKHGGSKVRGEHTRTVDFEGLLIKFNVRVVSSAVFDNYTMVLVRIAGDLGLWVASHNVRKEVLLCVLDFAKMPKPDNLLEDGKFGHEGEVNTVLWPAVVCQFVKDDRKAWQKLDDVANLDHRRSAADRTNARQKPEGLPA